MVTSLSLTTGYAIEALTCLARDGNPSMRVGEIAEIAEVPPAYLSKIFQRLAEAGIVESKRGYKGGLGISADAGVIVAGPVFHSAGDAPTRSRSGELGKFKKGGIIKILRAIFLFLARRSYSSFIAVINERRGPRRCGAYVLIILFVILLNYILF